MMNTNSLKTATFYVFNTTIQQLRLTYLLLGNWSSSNSTGCSGVAVSWVAFWSSNIAFSTSAPSPSNENRTSGGLENLSGAAWIWKHGMKLFLSGAKQIRGHPKPKNATHRCSVLNLKPMKSSFCYSPNLRAPSSFSALWPNAGKHYRLRTAVGKL